MRFFLMNLKLIIYFWLWKVSLFLKFTRLRAFFIHFKVFFFITIFISTPIEFRNRIYFVFLYWTQSGIFFLYFFLFAFPILLWFLSVLFCFFDSFPIFNFKLILDLFELVIPSFIILLIMLFLFFKIFVSFFLNCCHFIFQMGYLLFNILFFFLIKGLQIILNFFLMTQLGC